MITITENAEIALITGAVTIIATLISAVFAFMAQARAKEACDHSARATYEMTNSHNTNIRDDIDAISHKLDDMAGQVESNTHRLNSLSGELRRTESRLDDSRHVQDEAHRALANRVDAMVLDVQTPKHARRSQA